jgi:collagenase-like PrtC family protease
LPDAPHATRPEVLAPAGDRASLEAAVAAGADAVYFGLSSWSARARATNFSAEVLPETMAYLHRHGVKGYVALNTLVFDSELAAVEAAIGRCLEARVDALIVQDLGVARLAAAVAPGLPLHASTQMTCTDPGSLAFARSLGVTRVVVARELSLDDIAAIRRVSDVELEVFVHGALCVAYSGQCLTSEAIGGRSANRGACAQACRLPYDLIVDGKLEDRWPRAPRWSFTIPCPCFTWSTVCSLRCCPTGMTTATAGGPASGTSCRCAIAPASSTRWRRMSAAGTPCFMALPRARPSWCRRCSARVCAASGWNWCARAPRR